MLSQFAFVVYAYKIFLFFCQLFAISTVEVGYVFAQIFVCVKMDSTILAVCNLVMVFELHLLLENIMKLWTSV